MVFSSLEFIYLFLPPVLLVFYLLRHYRWETGIVWWLIVSSLAFYAWWSPVYLILLVSSVTANFFVHKLLLSSKSRLVLALGICGNLGLLIYFKYADFMIGNLNTFTGIEIPLVNVILPLAISFFTFQQISFLCDTYRGEITNCNFSKYCLFVVFFPQLIAGPIVLQKHTIPQFTVENFTNRIGLNFTVGTTLFVIGLFKKIVIADGIAPYSTAVFGLTEEGHALPIDVAWMGVVAYTFQIYFDFSGYSDMAIGIARLFGIILPLNFYSPYKAANISEFWRRWHITLSHFLRDYVYISLGGNRNGNMKRYSNLFLTMLLGGLWHGAGWNFIIWGALHGSYLMVNLGWQALKSKYSLFSIESKLYIFTVWLITFIAVVIGWVFFRAITLDGAISILSGMFGFNGIEIPNAILARLGSLGISLQMWGITPSNGGTVFIMTWFWNITLIVFVLTLPNIQDLFFKNQGTLSQFNYEKVSTFWPYRRFFSEISWVDTKRWAFFSGACLALGILTLSQVSEFLYFQF